MKALIYICPCHENTQMITLAILSSPGARELWFENITSFVLKWLSVAIEIIFWGPALSQNCFCLTHILEEFKKTSTQPFIKKKISKNAPLGNLRARLLSTFFAPTQKMSGPSWKWKKCVCYTNMHICMNR